MAEIIDRVQYAGPAYGFPLVERLVDPEEVTDLVAERASDVVAAAYADQFEQPKGPLPKGAIRGHSPFDVVSGAQASMRKYREKMKRGLEIGEQYWYIRDKHESTDPPSGESWVGLAHASPSRPNLRQRIGIGGWALQAPNCYVNDVVVHPGFQNLGLGIALLYTILEYGGFDPKRDLALDVIIANEELPRVVTDLGLEKVEEADVPPLPVMNGMYELAQDRYSSEGHTTIGQVAHGLSHPIKRSQWSLPIAVHTRQK